VRSARDGTAALEEAHVAHALLAEVRRFVRTIDSHAADREGRFDDEVLDCARALGLYALTIPADHGGLGLSLATTCRVVEAIAERDRSLAISVGLHAGLGTRGIVNLARASVRDRWLPAMANGSRIGAFAATEAGAGSDLTAIRTTLREAEGGYVLDGEKSFVTNGGFAGLFTVLASSPAVGGARAHTLVGVPAEARGVSLGREEDKLGIRASSTVTVRFDGVRVPAEHVLGAPGHGMALAHGLLAWGRTIMAAGALGTARAALTAALGHATSRRQFGRAIGTFAASREHVASMAARVFAMDAVVSAAAREASTDRLESLATVAKIFCSEEAYAVCDQALQLHGALGFIEPVGVARMLRDCRITRIFEGANDVLLVRLGAERVASRNALGGDFARRTDGAILALAARVDSAVDFVRGRFGVRAVRHQTILQHLARAEVCLRAAHAASRVYAAGDDAVLASLAVDDLLVRAERHLDAIAACEAREERVARLTDRLYDLDSPFAADAMELAAP
jgi:alkylation response protein AidB-like acyl-CoA dehydrogenase